MSQVGRKWQDCDCGEPGHCKCECYLRIKCMKSKKDIEEALRVLGRVIALSSNSIYDSNKTLDRLKAIEQGIMWAYYNGPDPGVNTINGKSIVADKAEATITGCKLLLEGMERQ